MADDEDEDAGFTMTGIAPTGDAATPPPMAMLPAAATAAKGGDEADYVFAFLAKRTEANIEQVALTKQGSLGAAAARSDTDFALTHSPTAVDLLVTDALEEVRLPLSKDLMNLVPDTVRQAVAAQLSEEAGPTVVLPARARLNITASRVAASINGTLVGTISGQGSVELQELFSDTVPLDRLIKQKDANTETGAAGDQEEEIHHAPLADGQLKAKMVKIPIPFETIPLKYPNWEAHQAVLSVFRPTVVRRDRLGNETPVSILWHDDLDHRAALAKVEPILQGIYNASWGKVKQVVFKLVENLTKSVMHVPVGFNASGFALAAAVNDTPVSFAAPTLEAVLHACLGIQLSEAERQECLTDLATPSMAATTKWAGTIATAVSAFSAFTMPYRIDGTPGVMPSGAKMIQSEFWRAEPVRSIFCADDCDGSCAGAVSLIKFAETAASEEFPALRALANSLGAHYIYGTSVLAANAGHADAANEHATRLAGHAVAVAISKASWLLATEKGLMGATSLPHGVTRQELMDANFTALYPESLRARLPHDEQAHLADFAAMKRAPVANVRSGLQPLGMEGTTYASSTLYTHDAQQRHDRQKFYAVDKQTSLDLAPNITRGNKTLDVGEKGDHAFYHTFVEIGLSMEHPLFTSATLRKHGQATPHFRFARPLGDNDSVITLAGATPEQLATQDFAVVPLWSLGTENAATIDLAQAEAAANVLPRRAEPHLLSAHEAASLEKSLASLKSLDGHLALSDVEAQSDSHHESLHLLSYASLVQNPLGVEAFCDTIRENGGITGEVLGLDAVLPGLARSKGADGQLQDEGRLVVLKLQVPKLGE